MSNKSNFLFTIIILLINLALGIGASFEPTFGISLTVVLSVWVEQAPDSSQGAPKQASMAGSRHECAGKSDGGQWTPCQD
jgi:hypothetical protein